MKNIYNERRIFMIRRLREMGLGITVEPTGAFYVFANARHISEDSYALAFDILEKAFVGVTPGIDFGSPKGDFRSHERRRSRRGAFSSELRFFGP